MRLAAHKKDKCSVLAQPCCMHGLCDVRHESCMINLLMEQEGQRLWATVGPAVMLARHRELWHTFSK